MSDLGDVGQGVLTLLDMLGGFVRKALRGKRTTTLREWRSRENSLLGLFTLLIVAMAVFFIWGFTSGFLVN